MWVVVYHFKNYLPPIPMLAQNIVGFGYIAVDFFFILSGFVIAYSYFNNLKEPNRKKLKIFFLKRFARVYPLHGLILIAYLIVPLAYYLKKDFVPDEFSASYYFLSALLVQNWGFTNTLAWNVPAWSISAEFAAYLLFPIMCIGLNKLGRLQHYVFTLIILQIFLIFIFKAREYESIGFDIVNLGTYRCLIEFAMGSILAKIYLDNFKLIRFQSILTFGLGFTLFIFMIIFLITDYYLAPVAVCLIIYGSLFLPTIVIKTITVPPLLYLGKISYSIYLVHYLVREVFKLFMANNQEIEDFNLLLLYVAVVVALSVLLYEYYEKPAKSYILNRYLHRI